MIKNYSDFQFELLFESLILESKIQYSDKFINLVSQIKKNRIAKELLTLSKNGADKNFTQNYIDTGKAKDEVTFTSDRKAKEFFGDDDPVIKYRVTHADRYLTNNKRNFDIFGRLGYTPGGEDDEWNPERGVIGTIKGEVKSNMSDRMYVWFVSEDGTKQTVLNKTAIVLYDEKLSKIWSTFRNNIKIGRLVRSVLTAAEIEFTDKEIEDFVNSYKSAYDIMNDAFLKFRLVDGREIAYWYSNDNYECDESTLGSSCMASVNDDYFDIYVNNKNCSLLILHSDNGTIQEGKYISKKIKGRALVWNTEQGDTFMDRIYTNYDSDVDLFKKYAFEKGWWCKVGQNSCQNFNVTDGTTTKSAEYTVKLEKSGFDYYPYVDSLSYINFDNKIISNYPAKIDAQGYMNDTSGEYEEIED